MSIQSTIGLNCGQTMAVNSPHLKTDSEAHDSITEECTHRVRKLMQEAGVILKNIAKKQTELFPADQKPKKVAA